MVQVVLVVTLHFWLCDGGEVWCVGCGGRSGGGVLDVEVEVVVVGEAMVKWR